MLKAVKYVPGGVLDAAGMADVRQYVGIDGRWGMPIHSAICYLEIQPLLGVGGKVGIVVPIGAYLSGVGVPFADLVRRVHVAFNLQVYGGLALYYAIADADAPGGVPHRVYTHWS